MKCQICGHNPRQFDLFGGDYWHLFGGDYWHPLSFAGMGTDHWLCPLCWYWANELISRFERREHQRLSGVITAQFKP